MKKTVYVVAFQSGLVGGSCGLDWYYDKEKARIDFESRKADVLKRTEYQLAFYSKELAMSPNVKSVSNSILISLDRTADEDFAKATETFPYAAARWNENVARAHLADMCGVIGEPLLVIDPHTADVSVVSSSLPWQSKGADLIPNGAMMIHAVCKRPKLHVGLGINLALAGSDEVPVLYYHDQGVANYHPAQYVRCNDQKVSIPVWYSLSPKDMSLRMLRFLEFILTPEIKVAIGKGAGCVAVLKSDGLSIGGVTYPAAIVQKEVPLDRDE